MKNNSEVLSIETRWMIDPNFHTLENQHLVVENGKFTYIGKFDQSKIPRGAIRIKNNKTLASPPFFNAHTHSPETLIRGLVDDTDLNDWLYNHVWVIEQEFTPNDGFIGAQLAIAEMIRGGTIGFNDQYFFANEIAKAVDQSGMKAYLSPSIFDNNPETGDSESAFNKNLEVLKKWHQKNNRIFIGFGPHATYTVSKEMFERIYFEAQKYDTIIHTHLHETKEEVKAGIKNLGTTPIQYLDNMKMMDRIYAAHAIHLNEKDMKIMKENNVPVLHNLQSNLKIGAGIANIPKYIDYGLNICLGTDGNASNNNLDMLEEVRLSALIHKGIANNPKLINSKTALQMGTRNASNLMPNQSYTGQLKEGDPADLILINLDHLNSTPIINPLSNWVFSANSDNVIFTMSNGTILYQDNEFKTLNISSIRSKAQKITERIMQQIEYTPNEFRN